MNDYKVFSYQEIDIIIRMHGEGASDQAIATIIGRTPKSVKHKRGDLGLVREQPSGIVGAELDERIRTLVAYGYSDELIAKETGRMPRTIANRRQKLRIVAPKAVVSDVRRDAIISAIVKREEEYRASNYRYATEVCRRHLIDLMREYAPGEALGVAKAAYRKACELDVPECSATPRKIARTLVVGSGCGSPAYMCVA